MVLQVLSGEVWVSNKTMKHWDAGLEERPWREQRRLAFLELVIEVAPTLRDVEVAFCPVDCVLESASNKNGTSPYAHLGTSTTMSGPRLGLVACRGSADIPVPAWYARSIDLDESLKGWDGLVKMIVKQRERYSDLARTRAPCSRRKFGARAASTTTRYDCPDGPAAPGFAALRPARAHVARRGLSRFNGCGTRPRPSIATGGVPLPDYRRGPLRLVGPVKIGALHGAAAPHAGEFVSGVLRVGPRALGPLYTNRPRLRDARFCGDVGARHPDLVALIKRNMHAYAEHAVSAASVRAYATHVLRHLGAAARYEPARRGDAVLGSSLFAERRAVIDSVVAEHARRGGALRLFCCFIFFVLVGSASFVRLA